MKFVFNHFNINVLNLGKSIEFYEKALGLKQDMIDKKNDEQEKAC